jgi:hypothetical protein
MLKNNKNKFYFKTIGDLSFVAKKNFKSDVAKRL